MSPPDRATLESLIARAGMRPRELLREKGTPYAELDLGAGHWTDGQLVDFMLAHPNSSIARSWSRRWA